MCYIHMLRVCVCGIRESILQALGLFMDFEQEIHSLKTELEAAKFDVMKYCIGIAIYLLHDYFHMCLRHFLLFC